MKIEVSNGEIIDKLTILQIKELKIDDILKINNIKKEIRHLLPILEEIGMTKNTKEYCKLLDINTELWNVEDRIREKEKLKNFDEEFISLARAAYTLNDKRSNIKKQININTKSFLIEEKNHDIP